MRYAWRENCLIGNFIVIGLVDGKTLPTDRPLVQVQATHYGTFGRDFLEGALYRMRQHLFGRTIEDLGVILFYPILDEEERMSMCRDCFPAERNPFFSRQIAI